MTDQIYFGMNQKIASFILMIAAGVILFIAGASVSRSINLIKHGTSIESTVLKRAGGTRGGSYQVTVTFNTSDGSLVTAKGSTRTMRSKGDKVKIFYDPAAPRNIDFGDTVRYNLRGVFIGGLLFLTGLYFFVRFSLKDSKKKKLISSGRKIEAEFVSIERNEKYRMGENNPWIIKCKWNDNLKNQVYYFVSKDYTIDPTPYLNGRYHIDVFLDPADPGKYYMDTSFMPKGNNTIG